MKNQEEAAKEMTDQLNSLPNSSEENIKTHPRDEIDHISITSNDITKKLKIEN